MKGSITKNKKTGKWDFVFDVGTDPLTGKRKQIKRRGFESKRHAMDEMTRIKAGILENVFLDLMTQISYSKYMEEWFQERKSRLQESTFEIHDLSRATNDYKFIRGLLETALSNSCSSFMVRR
ncbi:Arm DNA-binding domain-containing protein [Metabacillus litoralis]|uniref:Arm DNA-binding domain-containing protein n=1 Tax=Metabacillus litoralis TaxID=152268 RepID=UPI00204129BD|nr:Arm DNA-binding domain-containing protein [Metabacillus litoralis]MCM3653973.1 Arm DNA-binding domain-containing protein [Metabacillus litoralis]